VTERLVDAQAVADRLGVPVTWVRESTRSGAMPHVTLGRYKRYDLADVDRWLEACKQPGRPIALRSVSPGRAA
jgi:excisionase family DNA binding protein